MHGRHVIEHGYLAVDHSDVHMLAKATALPFIKRRQNTHDTEHTTTKIANGNSRSHRMLPIRPRNRHPAAAGLCDLVKGGPVSTRAL